jgi:hypothetical protein
MVADKADHDKALERIRTDLRQTAFEHEVRFARLHQTQAEVIAELYGKLVDCHLAGQEFLYGGAHVDEEKHRAFMKAHRGLQQFYERRRIYLPSVLCDQVSAFMSSVHQEVMSKLILRDFAPLTPDERKDRVDDLMKRWKFVTEEMPAVLGALVREFQAILGVANKSGTDPATFTTSHR